jgi:hypothetical protein
MKLLIVGFYPVFCLFLPLLSKRLPQHSNLEHLQPVHFPYHMITLCKKNVESFNARSAGTCSSHAVLKGYLLNGQWLLYIPPGLAFRTSTFCIQCEFVYHVWFSKETTIIYDLFL